jgi:class 3 adenylate cyclase
MGFGIGIGMGPATVGTIGYEGRLDYTAVGSAVNLASRLCDLAGDAQILVDHVVAEQVRGSIAVAWLGERTIKGYSRAVKVFAVGAVEPPRRKPNASYGNRLQPGTQSSETDDTADYSAAVDRVPVDIRLH